MNVYDFDHTIYPGDSTLDFWKWCIPRHPATLLALPGTLLAAVRFKLGLCSRNRFKETFYRFLRYIPNIECDISAFWDQRISLIEPWYHNQKSADDVIISASPEFLIGPACQRMGVQWIASEVDRKTGKLLGENCRGAEKVRRFRQVYPQGMVNQFYSDSRSDTPVAELAAQAYLVKKGNIKNWRENI
ncbi:haloacid dehalogenase-like hydrolase [Oscillibacter valericigenes]|nr:haloacid dehalogenase-like hydrolase [Oscillibacter valericigenes]